MPDSRFFTRTGPHALARIAELTGAELRGGEGVRMMEDVAPLESAEAVHISFLDNVKYADAFAASRAGACFVREKFSARAPKGMALLVTPEPYAAYAKAAQLFYPVPAVEAFISPAAHIDKSAKIGAGCRIEAGTWIGPDAEIGAHCHIGPNAVIGQGVQMGDDVRIGACSTVSHAIIGARVIVHRGVQIGQDGFGFAPVKNGILKVPQLGRVLIGDDVEIGSNSCIDRGAGPDTVIMDGAKIDNLVQIGHNVVIGAAAVIVSQVGIAGSSRVEAGAMLGGQAGIAGHVTIGAGAKIAAQGGIMRDVAPGEAVGGSPAVPIRQWHRQTAALERLSEHKGSN